MTLPASADSSAIKEEALRLELAMRNYGRHYIPAEESYLSIYIGVDEQSWVLQSASVALDGGESVQYLYSPLEVEALHQNGLHKISVKRVGRGSHHIEADFIAVKRGAAPDSARTLLHLDKKFEIDRGVEHIELNLVKTGIFRFLRKPSIQLRRWRRES